MITIECTLSPGRTGLVAELYVLGTDTPISSDSFAYKTNDKCRVVFTWSTTPDLGRYRFTVREGTTSYGLENDMVTIEGDGLHFLDREKLAELLTRANLRIAMFGDDDEQWHNGTIDPPQDVKITFTEYP